MGSKIIYDRFLRPRTHVIIRDNIEDVIESQNFLNRHHIIIFTNVENSEDDCPICCEKLLENIIKTECNHIFHKECLMHWINSSQTQRYNCPICVSNLTD